MAEQGITRRNFMQQSATWAAAFAAGSAGMLGPAFAARDKELNILCWEGYNSAQVLDPFRTETGATVKAESLTNDPTMINRLRAGEINLWDVIIVLNEC
jgi:spermidine/putrescine transport system substrate-binding protein